MVLHGYFLANAIRLQSLKCVVVGIVHSFMSSVHGPKRVLEIEVGGDGRWKTGALAGTDAVRWIGERGSAAALYTLFGACIGCVRPRPNGLRVACEPAGDTTLAVAVIGCDALESGRRHDTHIRLTGHSQYALWPSLCVRVIGRDELLGEGGGVPQGVEYV